MIVAELLLVVVKVDEVTDKADDGVLAPRMASEDEQWMLDDAGVVVDAWTAAAAKRCDAS